MTSPPVTVVVLPAELDLQTCDRARAELRAAARPGAAVIGDMTRTTFCDSTGVTALISASREIAESGSELRLAVTGPAVLRVLNVTGADQVLHVFASLDAAMPAGSA